MDRFRQNSTNRSYKSVLNMQKENKVYTEISSILSKENIEHSKEDVQEIINVTNQFYDSGYEFTYNEIASFLVSNKNLEYIKQSDLSTVIKAMKNMKLGPIVKKKEPSRNDKCICNSGKKYKNCCLK